MEEYMTEPLADIMKFLKAKAKGDEIFEKKIYDLELHVSSLLLNNDFLECLKQAGVDNWSGWSEAWSIFEGEEDESY